MLQKRSITGYHLIIEVDTRQEKDKKNRKNFNFNLILTLNFFSKIDDSKSSNICQIGFQDVITH